MTAMPRRVAQSMASVVDFQKLLQELVREGYSHANIAKIVGCPEICIKRAVGDLGVPEGWQVGVNLLDMYLLAVGKKPPFIG
jgi:dissimilatory sulfite reductase (desulfoviridin) alpha/beta subunit